MKFELYAESLGFKKTGKVYTMDYNGFKIYLRDWQYMVLTIQSFYIPLNKPLDKAMIKKMETASYNNACAAVALGEPGDTLVVTLADGKKDSEKTQEMIKAQILGVTAALKANGYGPMEKCPMCKEPAEFVTFGDHYCPCHDKCINEYKEKLTALAHKDDGFKPKHLLSILLAIIGAAIGTIPVALLARYKHGYFSGLLGLIPLFAILGYFLGHAPSKKVYKYIVGVIVMATVYTLLGLTLPYISRMHEDTVAQYCFTGSFLGLRKILVGVLVSFGGFGGMKFLDKFRRDYSKELKAFEEDNTLETLTEENEKEAD